MRTHIVTIAAAAHPFVQREGMKPDGFWYAIDDQWYNFVTRSMQCDLETQVYGENLTKCYEVVVDPDLDLLRLDTPEKIDKFTNRFAYVDDIFSEADPTGILNGMFIDWAKVASCYQGIELNPYPRRWMDYPLTQSIARWHISWDCASGCIWTREGYVLIERPDLLEKWRGEWADSQTE